jgi:TatD DNase family protein
MIDTHCHLNSEQFDDNRHEVLIRAYEQGVQTVIIPAIEPPHFDGLLALVGAQTELSPVRLYCSIGIHPHHAHEARGEDFARIEALLTPANRIQSIVAVGECGLDYYYDFAPRDVQRDVFRRQLRYAKEYRLPVIIHNRESDDDILALLEAEQDGTLRGVLHCFSSSVEVLDRALALGMMVSFTGNITYKKSTLADVVARVPLTHCMIETDAPYMSPTPYRGKRNEPSYVRAVAKKIAEIRAISVEDVITQTTKNAVQLFGI